MKRIIFFVVTLLCFTLSFAHEKVLSKSGSNFSKITDIGNDGDIDILMDVSLDHPDIISDLKMELYEQYKLDPDYEEVLNEES